MYISADARGFYSRSLSPPKPVGKWFWDLANWGDSNTISNFADYPSYIPTEGANVDVYMTQVVGIACRCLRDRSMYRKELADAGTMAIHFTSNSTRDVGVHVEDNVQWGGVNVQGDLLTSAKWIDVMNASAPAGAKKAVGNDAW